MNHQSQLDQLFNDVLSSQINLIQKQKEDMINNERTDAFGNDFDKQFDIFMGQATEQIIKHKGQPLIYFSIGSFSIGIVEDKKNVVQAVVKELIKKFGGQAKIYLLEEKRYGYCDIDIRYEMLSENSRIPPTGQFAIQFNNVLKKVLPDECGLIAYYIIKPFIN
jgi:predicted metal-dependent hydrolase